MREWPGTGSAAPRVHAKRDAEDGRHTRGHANTHHTAPLRVPEKLAGAAGNSQEVECSSVVGEGRARHLGEAGVAHSRHCGAAAGARAGGASDQGLHEAGEALLHLALALALALARSQVLQGQALQSEAG